MCAYMATTVPQVLNFLSLYCMICIIRFLVNSSEGLLRLWESMGSMCYFQTTRVFKRFNIISVTNPSESTNYELELKDGKVYVNGMKNPLIKLQEQVAS